MIAVITLVADEFTHVYCYITTWLRNDHYVISNRCYVLRRFLRDQYIRGETDGRHVYCFEDSWKTFIYFNLAFVLKWDARAAKLINYAVSPRNILQTGSVHERKTKTQWRRFLFHYFYTFQNTIRSERAYFVVWQFKFLWI